MTARGRQYYDPEIQAHRSVPGEQDLERIEVYPVGLESTARLPQEIGKWAARRVDGKGVIREEGASDTQQNRAIDLARERWPGLEVYVVNAEIEDSTWEGVGPSPRLWQAAFHQPPQVSEPGRPADVTPAVEPEELFALETSLHVIQVVKPGHYLLLEDVLRILNSYADQYDAEGNPSAALGIREAADALGTAF